MKPIRRYGLVFKRRRQAENVSSKARERRNLLIDALSCVELVNYPSEWWHWSYGDRYWAVATGTPAAIYGPL